MAKLISKTYGDALFEVAAEENKLESHLKEVEAVLDVLKENEEYINIIGYPRIPIEEKKTMIESAFKGKVSDDMVGFLTVIAHDILTGVFYKPLYSPSLLHFAGLLSSTFL